jgi:hypothetical protein
MFVDDRIVLPSTSGSPPGLLFYTGFGVWYNPNMSKKAKKAARELQRLQNLYQTSNVSQPIGVSQSAIAKSVSAVGQTATVSPHHGYVKRDLWMLLILLVVMVAALIGLNLLAEHTAFGTALSNLVGKMF